MASENMSNRSKNDQLNAANDTFEVRRAQKSGGAATDPVEIFSGIKVPLWILRYQKCRFGRVGHFGGGTTFLDTSDIKPIV